MITGYVYEKVNEVFKANDIVVPYNMLTLNFENVIQKDKIIKQAQSEGASAS